MERERSRYFMNLTFRVVPAGDEYLLCVPEKSYFSVIDGYVAELFARLADGPMEVEDEFIQHLLDTYVRAGILNVDPGERMTVERFLDTDSIAIMPVYACNLKCVYCITDADEGEFHKVASVEAMLGLVDFVIAQNVKAGRHKAKIAITGAGEPTLAWERLATFVDEANNRARKNDQSVIWRTTTNGTFTAAAGEWLLREMHGVTFSVDGPAFIQDAQRPPRGGGSNWDRIYENLKRFDEAKANYMIQTTLSAVSVTHFEKIVDYFLGEFDPRQLIVDVAAPYGRYNRHPELHRPIAAEEMIDRAIAVLRDRIARGYHMTFGGIPQPTIFQWVGRRETAAFQSVDHPTKILFLTPDERLIVSGEFCGTTHPFVREVTVGKWNGKGGFDFFPERFGEFLTHLQQGPCRSCELSFNCLPVTQIVAPTPMGGNRCDIIRLAFRRFQELTDAERPSLDIEHIPENCVRCGLCVQKCVSEALHIEKGACPQRNLDQCVQCYGCVEVCPVRGWNIVKKRA